MFASSALLLEQLMMKFLNFQVIRKHFFLYPYSWETLSVTVPKDCLHRFGKTLHPSKSYRTGQLKTILQSQTPKATPAKVQE